MEEKKNTNRKRAVILLIMLTISTGWLLNMREAQAESLHHHITTTLSSVPKNIHNKLVAQAGGFKNTIDTFFYELFWEPESIPASAYQEGGGSYFKKAIIIEPNLTIRERTIAQTPPQPTTTLPLPAPPPRTAPAPPTPTPTTERIIETVRIESGITEQDIIAQLKTLENKLRQEIANQPKTTTIVHQSAPSNPNPQSNFQAIALTQKIDQLSGVTITNSTIEGGLSGLTDNDIPNDITASNYLLLSGGTLSGYLSIGTSTRSEPLTINGAIHLGATTTPSTTNERLYNESGTLYWSGNVIGGATVGTWETDGSHVYRASGNVGIGTTSPYAKLSVSGQTVAEYFTATSTATSTFAGGLNVLAINQTRSATSTFNNGINLANGCLALNGACVGTTLSGLTSDQFLRSDTSDSFTSGTLTFDAGTILRLSNTGANMLLTTDASGNVVSSSTPVVAAINATSTTATSTFAGGLIAGGTTGLTVLQTGNVGIGTTSPFAKLSVTGNIFADNVFTRSDNFATVLGEGAGDALNADGLGNTALGYQTLQIATSSDYNVALGYQAGQNMNAGDDYNVAIGYRAGQNMSGAGDYNVALGYLALQTNNGGNGNVAIGTNALRLNTTGSYNMALGYSSLESNTTGGNNVGVGRSTLNANTTGGSNLAFGFNALSSNISGSNNVGIGISALQSNTTASNNVGIGVQALQQAAGQSNTAIGVNALQNTTTGIFNTAIGAEAARYNGSATGTVAIGYQAGRGPTTGTAYQNSTFLGYQTGLLNEGDNNLLIGYNTGNALTTGANNIAIGYDIDLPSNTASNQLTIGNLIFGTGINGTGTTLSSGNIGIASSTPWGKLSVEMDTTNPSFVVGNSGSSTPALFVGGVNQNGKIGIGTTNPSANLHIKTNEASDVSLKLEGATGQTADRLQILDSVGNTMFKITGSGGNVGIGTSSPTYRLAVDTPNFMALNLRTTHGNSSVKILSNPSGASGGVIYDVAGGANFHAFQNQGIESMRITSSGNLGIGTTTPWRTLSVSGTIGLSSSLTAESGSDEYLCIDPTTYEVTQGGVDCGASSLRYKEDIEGLTYGLDTILSLNPVFYRWSEEERPNDRNKYLGFIAEEMELTIPEIVSKNKDGQAESIDYNKLTAVIVKGMQDLHEMVKRSTTEIREIVEATIGRFSEVVATSITSDIATHQELQAGKLQAGTIST